MNPEKIRIYWDAARVVRYHTAQTLRTQNLADHQWGVAMIVSAVAGEHLTVELLKAALAHDLSEKVTGDVPAPAKWASESLTTVLKTWEDQYHEDHSLNYTLTKAQLSILKWADMCELFLFCLNERELGNTKMFKLAQAVYPHLKTFPTEEAKEFLKDVIVERAWHERE